MYLRRFFFTPAQERQYELGKVYLTSSMTYSHKLIHFFLFSIEFRNVNAWFITHNRDRT